MRMLHERTPLQNLLYFLRWQLGETTPGNEADEAA